MKKRIVITGQNGQLGQYLIKYLLETQDLEIIGTIRHKSYDNQPYIFDRTKIKTEIMDLADPHSIESLIVKYRPDYFINTAANAFVGESWALPVLQIEQNCLGVLHQLEAIRKHSSYTRYFNMGTSEEFGCAENNGPQDENTKIDPKSPYGCAKAAARYLVNTYRRSYGLYAIQGWTYNFEGPLRGIKYVTKKITTNVARIAYALNNNQNFEPLELGFIHSNRSWQHCEDVCSGVWKMMNQEDYNPELKAKLVSFWISNYGVGEGDVVEFLSENIKQYVLSGKDTYTVKEFVEASFLAAGISGGFWSGEELDETYKIIKDSKEIILMKVNKDFYRPSDVTYLNGDSSLIKKELGWEPTIGFNQLVKEMVEYDIKNYKLCEK